MSRDPADRLPTGTPLPEGWGGTVAPDHNAQGLFTEGPQPAQSVLGRLIGVQAVAGEPLPPGLAQTVLSRSARGLARLRSILTRTAPPPKPRGGRLQRLHVGRGRVEGR